MQRILVFSDSRQNSAELRRLTDTLPYEVSTTHDAGSLFGMVESKIFALTIIDQGVMDEKMVAIIDDLRKSGYAFPILVITARIHTAQKLIFDSLKDVHVLVRPILEKNVFGLIRKLLVSRRVPKQISPRYNTNQIAQVEALGSGENLLTSLYNLSKSGAYCEFDGGTPLAVGDLFRIKVYLDDTKNEYTFNAKVVWTTPSGRFSGRYGCGFKFISAKDSYRALLSR